MRTRKESHYRQSNSSTGTYSPKINKFTADRLAAYCELENLNKTDVVCTAINEYLDERICEAVDKLPKDVLLDLFIKKLDRELSTEQLRKIMKEYVLNKPFKTTEEKED